jgi:ABC-type uncharacterized transport system involved in gliding motility auxiliary subunit
VKRILGILGWLGVGLVVAAVVLRFAKPELSDVYRSLSIAGLVITLIYAAGHWREIGRSFQGRQTQYGSVAAGSVVVFLAILVAVNWIANRQNKRWDLTEAKVFSLSDQTRQIISTLKAPLKITVFYAPPDSMQNYRDQLDGYQYLSSQVSVSFVNAVASPTEAEKNAVTAVPTLILEYGGRTQRATSADEQAVTNALKKVIEGQAKKIYFTEGHGERDPDDASSRQGYKAASSALADDNFEVAKLQIAQKGAIPADATVIVIAGPTTDFLPQEIELLRAYLAGGGKVLLMIDPPPAKGAAAPPAGLLAMAKEWGIQVGDDIVVDPNGQQLGADASVVVGMPASHTITKDFRKMTAFRVARSVTPVQGGVEGRFPQTFEESGPGGWSETDVKGLYTTGRPEKNLDKGDKTGPVPVAAVVSAPATSVAGAAAAAGPDAPKPEARLAVIGDSDFASNADLGFQGNGDLFLNTANWLAQQENLIAIRPKDPEDRRLQLTADQQGRVFWFTVIIMPLLLFANAFRLYWKRR